MSKTKVIINTKDVNAFLQMMSLQGSVMFACQIDKSRQEGDSGLTTLKLPKESSDKQKWIFKNFAKVIHSKRKTKKLFKKYVDIKF